MSYDKIKGITFKNDKVFFRGAESNVRPLIYYTYEVPFLSEIYREKGKAAVFAKIGENIWDGNYQIYGGSKYCKLFLEARNLLSDKLNWSNSDSKAAGQFLAKAVIKLENDPYADLTPEVNEFLSLMNNREHIIEVAHRSGRNILNYANEELQNDKELALAVLRAGEGRAWFDYPAKFTEDKEFALEALKLNGCFYRSLDVSLRGDKEIIFEAFKQAEGKTYYEHLPDLIPRNVYFDFENESTEASLNKSFVMELLDCCPSLHINRAKWLLEDRDIALRFCEVGKWALNNLDSLPKTYLQEKQFQEILISRCETDEVVETLRTRLSIMGIQLNVHRRDALSHLIFDAENRKSEEKTVKSPGILKEDSKNI